MQTQSRARRAHGESPEGCFLQLASSPANNTASNTPKEHKYFKVSEKFCYTKMCAGLCVSYLYHACLRYRCDCLKVASDLLQTVGNILIKQYSEICSLRLGLTGVYPACHIPVNQNEGLSVSNTNCSIWYNISEVNTVTYELQPRS